MNYSPYVAAAEPRATHIHLPHRSDLGAEIWMGGSDSVLGDAISLADVARAHVVDLAGDLPAEFRAGAQLYIPRVFMDAEMVPFAFQRLAALVLELASTIRSAASHTARVYILCQYGLNRSGLITGLLLRALGEPPRDSIELIRRMRPGALSNDTFVALIADWEGAPAE